MRCVVSRRPAVQTPIEIFASKRAEEPSVDHDGGSNELVDLLLDPGLDILFDEPDLLSERAAGLGKRTRGPEKPQQWPRPPIEGPESCPAISVDQHQEGTFDFVVEFDPGREGDLAVWPVPWRQ